MKWNGDSISCHLKSSKDFYCCLFILWRHSTHEANRTRADTIKALLNAIYLAHMVMEYENILLIWLQRDLKHPYGVIIMRRVLFDAQQDENINHIPANTPIYLWSFALSHFVCARCMLCVCVCAMNRILEPNGTRTTCMKRDKPEAGFRFIAAT